VAFPFCGRELRAVISGGEIITRGTNKEKVCERGYMRQFWKGTREQGAPLSPPYPLLCSALYTGPILHAFFHSLSLGEFFLMQLSSAWILFWCSVSEDFFQKSLTPPLSKRSPRPPLRHSVLVLVSNTWRSPLPVGALIVPCFYKVSRSHDSDIESTDISGAFHKLLEISQKAAPIS